MGFFPGRQRSRPSKRSRRSGGGGGGGSSPVKPVPFQTGSFLDPKLNAERQAANKARGVGDSAGRSTGDPDFGKPVGFSSRPKPTIQEKPKVKPQISKEIARANFIKETARKQQISKATRRFALGVVEKQRRLREKKLIIPIKEKPEEIKRKVTIPQKKKGLAGVSERVSREKTTALTKVQTSKSVINRQFNGIVVLGALGAARGGIGVLKTIKNPIKTTKEFISTLKTPRQTAAAIGKEFITDPIGTAAEFFVFSKTLNLVNKGAKKTPVARTVQEELFIRSQPKNLQKPVRAIIKSANVQKRLNPKNVKTINKVNFAEVKSLNAIEARALARTLRDTDSVVFGSLASRTLGGKRLPLPKDVDLATASIEVFNKKFLNNLPRGSRNNYLVKGEKIIRKSNKEPILDVKTIDRLIPQKSVITRRGVIPAVGFVKQIKGLRKLRQLRNLENRLGEARFSLSRTVGRKNRLKLKKQIKSLKKKISKEKKKFKPSELVKLEKKAKVGGLTFPTQKVIKVEGIKLTGFGEQTLRKGLGTLQVLIEKNIRRAKDPQSFLIGLKVQVSALKRVKSKNVASKLLNKRKIKTLETAIKILSSKEFASLLNKKVPGLTKEFPLVAKISGNKLKNINLKTVNKKVKEKLPKPPKPKPFIKKPEKKKKIKTKKKETKQKKKEPKKTEEPKFKPVKPKLKPSSKVLKKKGFRPSKVKKRVTKAKKRVKRKPSKLPSRIKRSKLPKSRLKPSRLPSRIRPSRLKGTSKIKPSKTPPSKLKPSKVPPSKIPPSKITPSKLKPSKVPPSKLTPSRIPPSRLPPSRLKQLFLNKTKNKPFLRRKSRTKKEEERVIRWVKQQKPEFRPSLAAILFDIHGIPDLKNITGFEIRPIPIFKKKVTKTRKKTKRLKKKRSKKKR